MDNEIGFELRGLRSDLWKWPLLRIVAVLDGPTLDAATRVSENQDALRIRDWYRQVERALRRAGHAVQRLKHGHLLRALRNGKRAQAHGEGCIRRRAFGHCDLAAIDGEPWAFGPCGGDPCFHTAAARRVLHPGRHVVLCQSRRDEQCERESGRGNAHGNLHQGISTTRPTALRLSI